MILKLFLTLNLCIIQALIGKEIDLKIHKKKAINIQVDLAAFYSASRVYRGVLIWNAPMVAAGPNIIINDKYGFGRGGISYINNLDKYHRVSFGTNAFDDSEPRFPFVKLVGDSEDYKTRRKPTYGFYAKYEYTFERSFKFEMQFNRDLGRYHSNYLATEFMYSFIPLVAFGINLGFGEKAHNEYVYGEGAKFGHAHNDYFMSILFPFLPYNGIMIIKSTIHEVIGKDKYNSDYIRGNNVHSNVSIVSVWKL